MSNSWANEPEVNETEDSDANDAMVVAFLDANVFVSIWTIDVLLTLSEDGLFTVTWSPTVLDEASRALARIYPHTQELNAKRMHAINSAFPYAMQPKQDWEWMVPDCDLPDPNDRHVLAAARAANATVIVTFNLRDFPSGELNKFGIIAQSPDQFLADIAAAEPERTMRGILNLVNGKNHPPRSMDEEIIHLERLGFHSFTRFLKKSL